MTETPGTTQLLLTAVFGIAGYLQEGNLDELADAARHVAQARETLEREHGLPASTGTAPPASDTRLAWHALEAVSAAARAPEDLPAYRAGILGYAQACLDAIVHPPIGTV